MKKLFLSLLSLVVFGSSAIFAAPLSLSPNKDKFDKDSSEYQIDYELLNHGNKVLREIDGDKLNVSDLDLFSCLNDMECMCSVYDEQSNDAIRNWNNNTHLMRRYEVMLNGTPFSVMTFGLDDLWKGMNVQDYKEFLERKISKNTELIDSLEAQIGDSENVERALANRLENYRQKLEKFVVELESVNQQIDWLENEIEELELENSDLDQALSDIYRFMDDNC